MFTYLLQPSASPIEKTIVPECSALFWPVDDSAGIFQLFQFPSDVLLHKEWQVRSGVNLEEGRNDDKQMKMFLCVVSNLGSAFLIYYVYYVVVHIRFFTFSRYILRAIVGKMD